VGRREAFPQCDGLTTPRETLCVKQTSPLYAVMPAPESRIEEHPVPVPAGRCLPLVAGRGTQAVAKAKANPP